MVRLVCFFAVRRGCRGVWAGMDAGGWGGSRRVGDGLGRDGAFGCVRRRAQVEMGSLALISKHSAG